MEIIIGIVGSVASIIGAAISLIQSRKARKAKSEAEEIRKSIHFVFNAGQLNSIFSNTKRILNKLSIFGPGSSALKKTGISTSELILEIQECIEDINVDIYKLEKENQRKVNAFKKKCQKLLEEIDSGKTQDSIFHELYLQFHDVVGFLSKAKQDVIEKQ